MANGVGEGLSHSAAHQDLHRGLSAVHPEPDSLRVHLDIMFNSINTNSSLSLSMAQTLC